MNASGSDDPNSSLSIDSDPACSAYTPACNSALALPSGVPSHAAVTQQPVGQYYCQQAPQQPQYVEELRSFWQEQLQEAHDLCVDASTFKTLELPLARIKKIMKSDGDVRMISGEVPVLFAKACEIFILELTLRAWLHADANKRRTLQRTDVAVAIARTEMYDFLVDIVPREEAGCAAGPMLPPQMPGAQQQMWCMPPPVMQPPLHNGQPPIATGQVAAGQEVVGHLPSAPGNIMYPQAAPYAYSSSPQAAPGAMMQPHMPLPWPHTVSIPPQAGILGVNGLHGHAEPLASSPAGIASAVPTAALNGVAKHEAESIGNASSNASLDALPSPL